MVIDGRTLPDAEQLEADVCIIGAGPAGISLTLELARAGWRVCLLESGGREPHPETQKLNEGRSVGYWYYPLRATRVRAFGGTSAGWAATPAEKAEGWRARPFDPIDFECRAEIPYSGWPFGYPELRPFYERAQRLCRLGPYDSERLTWAWASDDPAVDELQTRLAAIVEGAQTAGEPIGRIYGRVRAAVHAAAGRHPAGDALDLALTANSCSTGEGRPRLTEPWFC